VRAGEHATAVGGVVERQVRRVEVVVDGVRRNAKLKDGFYLRLMRARGDTTVRAFDGDGMLLRERTFGPVPPRP
jgi:hypothetical protein